jgi:hypothetical protein
MEEVSQQVMLDLGLAMSGCLKHAVDILQAGMKTGEFRVDDADLLANVFYTQGLGVLNLATLQLSVREENPGLPAVDAVPFEVVKTYMQTAVVAMARGTS